ncbi:MAG: aminotransferase class I/II-fold pyridoxal phosphate-dependent enzyme, partial [Saprospiraceae bacterium]
MEQQLVYGQKADEMRFQLTGFGTLDSNKYTLFEVLFDPRLEKLSLDERISLLNKWVEDGDRTNITFNRRYSFNGCATEREVFDPSVNRVVRMVNFGSNDYLNMSQHPRVIGAAVRALETYGAGAGASCITAGRTKVKSDLEEEIADTFQNEMALVYPTGYMTNTGVLTCLLRSNDVAIVDMFAHASIIDGVENRNKLFFQHNDMRSLERAMIKANSQYADKIVVVDGVYSMDGDIANLPEIVGLCKKYSCKLMVDEAHAFGVVGKNGLGMADHFDLPPDTIDILVGTLSKAIGSTGGFVTGKKDLINYLRFASRPYFFTTAPFVPAMAAALESIRVIKSDQQRHNNLWENIRYFRSKILAGGFNIGTAQAAIFPIILGNHNLIMNAPTAMGNMGVLAVGVPYPAVSRKQTRIRMNVTSEMTQAHLDKGYDV